MISVNIVGFDNGAGLTEDAKIVSDALVAAGFKVTWSKRYRPSKFVQFIKRRGILNWTLPWYDVNLFLERIDPLWFPFASRNVLVPNPEWFSPEMQIHLGGIDLVLCKSREAQMVFGALGARTCWTGFSGRDRGPNPIAPTRPLKALHLAGRSEHKGTKCLLNVWRKHPEWPELTVVRRALNEKSEIDVDYSTNIRFITHRLTESEVLDLQRNSGLHILPSEVEGFGQSLIESLSVAAVTITTDAPPMNEIVRPEHGVLVPATIGEALCLGRRYSAVESCLESAIADVLRWPDSTLSACGSAGRAWFVSNDLRFRADFPKRISELASTKK